MKKITFIPLAEQDHAAFRNDVKRIFSIKVTEEFGQPKDGKEIIPDADINLSLQDSRCETFAVYADGEKVGGIVVKTAPFGQHNWPELFYIYPEYHSQGIGVQIWQAIEQKYPKTKTWRLITPYFEKRNIHFYVNKCGFKIVEFFNKHHQAPDKTSNGTDFQDEYFIFEKKMEL